ncbi:hypothetical protein NECAME_10116 [Necator americanus]|uniref:Uncharacterized protein n=1 Tax=Necator americanus TaxID=51031 RepID=W2TCC1_NECAM|nr:hypothetical protein NECAME_10116 [Necator americanus]ETN78816.1 hypothetical protein NECAME_10116 [Necator americanus]
MALFFCQTTCLTESQKKKKPRERKRVLLVHYGNDKVLNNRRDVNRCPEVDVSSTRSLASTLSAVHYIL